MECAGKSSLLVEDFCQGMGFENILCPSLQLVCRGGFEADASVVGDRAKAFNDLAFEQH